MSETPITTSGYKPDPGVGQIYEKPGFTLSYAERYEVAEWVSYTLTRDMLDKPKFERNQDFEPDPQITSGSAHYRDYKGSGFRRGHLVPAADMAWHKSAMDATFLMSNVVPMRQAFNDGIWLELEQNVRDWARKYGEIRIVSGPVLEDIEQHFGRNEVHVPRFFYKAVFTANDANPKVIAFLLDQEADTYNTLDQYVISVDSLEQLTGIDLFSNLYGQWDTEITSERRRQWVEQDWPLNERWYLQRQEASSKW